MKKNSKKAVVLLLVLTMLIGGTIGGTLAWLIAETEPVVNTFTVGNIEITLTETEATKAEGQDLYTKSFKMVPGTDIPKDPTVTVAADSEACWLFVEVAAESTEGYITYAIAGGWEKIGETNVYGRKVTASNADQAFPILKDNKVHVPDTVTKAMLEKVTNGTVVAPKLTFTAYAIQSANLTRDGNAVTTPADAWYVYNNQPQQPENP